LPEPCGRFSTPTLRKITPLQPWRVPSGEVVL
jgi:hypothetical protein